MKRPLAIFAALLLTASLSSCSVAVPDGAETSAPAPETQAAEAETTARETEPTPAPASATDDEYTENY